MRAEGDVFGARHGDAGEFVLEPRDGGKGVMRGDEAEDAHEEGGEDPEHDEAEADHPDGGIEELAVEAEAAAVADREGEGDKKGDPDRQELARDRADDAGRAVGHEDAAEDIGKKHDEEREEREAERGLGEVAEAAAGGGRAVGLGCVGEGGGQEVRDERQERGCAKRDGGRQQERIEEGAELAGPGEGFHGCLRLIR